MAMLLDSAQARPVGPTTTWVACAASAARLAAQASAAGLDDGVDVGVCVAEGELFFRRDRPLGPQILGRQRVQAASNALAAKTDQ